MKLREARRAARASKPRGKNVATKLDFTDAVGSGLVDTAKSPMLDPTNTKPATVGTT